HLEGHPVVLERGVNVLAEVLARHPRDRAAGEPVAMPLVGVVHAVHEVGHPAGVRLDADELEPGMALEHAAEDEEPDDVLAAADDRHERVELWPASLERVAAAGEDMERQR